MKVRELMIGDYLRCKETGRCLRVMQLTGVVGDNIMLEDGTESDDSTFEPILLTEEILKANGFSHPKFDDGTEVKHIMAYDKDGLMWLNKENDYFYISSSDAYIHIRYVHELQHALRLCGLTDLANNFKIQ